MTLTAEQRVAFLAQIEVHAPHTRGPGGVCTGCDRLWPCALATLANDRVAVTRLPEPLVSEGRPSNRRDYRRISERETAVAA